MAELGDPEQTRSASDDEPSCQAFAGLAQDGDVETGRQPLLEREHIEGLRNKIGSAVVAYVPYLAHDVYDFEVLHEIGDLLLSSDTLTAQ